MKTGRSASIIGNDGHKLERISDLYTKRGGLSMLCVSNRVTSSVGCFLILASNSLMAQDAMFVDSLGNVGVGTNTPAKQLHVEGTDGSSLTSNNVQLRVENTAGTTARRDLIALSNNGGVKFTMENRDSSRVWDFSTRSNGFNINLLGTGGQEFLISPFGEMRVGPGGVENFVVKPNGDVFVEGSLVHSSSREEKEQITSVNYETVLAKLAHLELSEWTYKDAAGGDRHLSPMAEDFHGLFGLGPGSRHISPTDLAGVALAAAKALDHENTLLKEKNSELREEVKQIKAELDNIRSTLSSISDYD